MKILVVAPGPTHSTFDTFSYYTLGFRQNGNTVLSFDYHHHFAYHIYATSRVEDKADDDPYVQRKAMMQSAEVLISRVARTRPDIIFIVSGLALPLAVWDWLDEFKSSLRVPYKVVLLLTESPYLDNDQRLLAGKADIVFTTERKSVEKISAVNGNTYYIRHAFFPGVHRTTPYSEKHNADVFMVGTGFPERVDLLRSVGWDGVDLRIYGDYWAEYDDGTLSEFIYPTRLDNKLEVPLFYSNSKINLNIFRTATWPGASASHIDRDAAASLSPRCYEVMGCGGFLLTDPRDELFELFDVGKSMDVYDNNEELGSKVRYYLANDDRREAISRAGWYAVRQHTYADRAREIVDVVKNIG